MAIRKYVKKQVKRAGKYVKKRYFKGKGYSNPKISTIARDVMRLKSIVNSEKQNAESTSTATHTLGQFNGATTGFNSFALMPTIAQGVGEDQRKGDSIKVCSWCLKIQAFNYGPDTVNDVNYKFYVVTQPVNPVGAATAGFQFLEANPFSGVIDSNSNRNYQHYKDFRVLGVISGKLKAMDDPSSTSARTNNHTLARKQEFHIRYQKGTTTIMNNDIYLIAVASDGDIATANRCGFMYSFKVYYYDN